jgi:FkbM family methyltransferase
MCFYAVALNAQYYSQSGQDRYLNEHLFKGKRQGIFIDVGAHDGITYSNTYFFEKELGWNGICIEPIPALFKRLQNSRRCMCLQGCISNKNEKSDFLCITSYIASEYTEMLSGLWDSYDPRHIKRIDNEVAQFGGKKEIIEVQCYRLDHLFEQHNIMKIDYLSIDVEGAEMKVLESIDFTVIDIDVISIENNYGTECIKQFLMKRGYQYIITLDGDEIYQKKR